MAADSNPAGGARRSRTFKLRDAFLFDGAPQPSPETMQVMYKQVDEVNKEMQSAL